MPEGIKPKPQQSPDTQSPKEKTIQVRHEITGKCSLDGQLIEITFNPVSSDSLNKDPRTLCSECHITLI